MINFHNFKLGCLLFVVIFSFDRSLASKDKKNESINDIMVQFSSHLVELEPYMISIDKFKDPKNDPKISQHLKTMVELSKKVSHTDKMQNFPGLRFSRELLERHLTETERIFRLGNKEYAQWMMNTTVNICLSCHTQMPGIERNFETFKTDENLSLFEQAEILYTFRNFEKANSNYDLIIKNYPSNGVKIDQVETSIRRKLAYFVRIKQDPDGAIKSLKGNALNKNLPLVIRKNINDWISQLKGWKKVSTPKVETANEEEVRKFVTQLMGPDLVGKAGFTHERLISYLRVSGFLYTYLGKHKQNDFTGEVLYWLALCDRHLSNDLFYSLADIYLKDCVRDFSKTPIARKCFDEYKDGIIFSYTGSAGTNIPPEVSAELKELEKLLPAQKK